MADVLTSAMIRLGEAILAGGPVDDIGPPPEVTEEYYDAIDAVKLLAVGLAKEFEQQVEKIRQELNVGKPARQEFIEAAAVLFDAHGPVTGSPEWQAAWAKAAEALKGIR